MSQGANGGAADIGGFRRLWSTAPVRRTFLLWTLTAIALQFGYYGANTWLPSYLVHDLGVELRSMGYHTMDPTTTADMMAIDRDLPSIKLIESAVYYHTTTIRWRSYRLPVLQPWLGHTRRLSTR